MVERCRAAFEEDVMVINIHEIDIKASCLGCLQCGSDQHCAYEGKDGFIDFYRTQVMAADYRHLRRHDRRSLPFRALEDLF